MGFGVEIDGMHDPVHDVEILPDISQLTCRCSGSLALDCLVALKRFVIRYHR